MFFSKVVTQPRDIWER